MSLSNDDKGGGGVGRKEVIQKNTLPSVVLCVTLKRVPGISVCSPPACLVSGPVGTLYSPLPCKHVCIPSMLPCFCLYGDLSTDLLIQPRPHLRLDQDLFMDLNDA